MMIFLNISSQIYSTTLLKKTKHVFFVFLSTKKGNSQKPASIHSTSSRFMKITLIRIHLIRARLAREKSVNQASSYSGMFLNEIVKQIARIYSNRKLDINSMQNTTTCRL